MKRAFFHLVDTGKVGPKCIILLSGKVVRFETSLMGVLASQSFMCWLSTSLLSLDTKSLSARRVIF